MSAPPSPPPTNTSYKRSPRSSLSVHCTLPLSLDDPCPFVPPPTPRSPAHLIAAPKLHPSSHRGRRRRRPSRRTPRFPGSLAPTPAAARRPGPVPAAGRPPHAVLGHPRPVTERPVQSRGGRRTGSIDPFLLAFFFFLSVTEPFSWPSPASTAAQQPRPARGPAGRSTRTPRSRGPFTARAVFFRGTFSFSCWTDFQTLGTFKP